MGNLRRSRRHVLAATGMLSLSGCANVSLLESEIEDVRLGSLFLRNATDGEQSLQLQFRRNDEDVYEDDWTLGEDEATVVDPTWEPESPQYEIVYATEGGVGVVTIPDDYGHVVDDDGCYHPRAHFSPTGFDIELFAADEMSEGEC